MVRRIIRRGAIAGAVLLGIEAAYAVLRPSPELPEFDPSATFGDEGLPTLRVAVLGDSSVTAPGVSEPGEIWVTRVCDRLADSYRVELKSFAVGGSTAHELVNSQMEDAILFDPHLIFVSVGSNDAIKGVSRRRFERSLDHLVGELAETGAIVVQSGVGDLGTIPRLVPPLRNLMSRRARGFDRIHWKVAERHGTTVVPHRSDDPNVWYEDRSLWADDLFHVSAAGHARWANTVWKTVEQLVPRMDE